MRLVRMLREMVRRVPKAALYILTIFALLGAFAPWIVPKDPLAQDLLSAGQSFSAEHWLGTDHLGRDTLSRLIASARTSLVGLVLMIAQAFFYNAIFFTFALVLTDFYGIQAGQVGWYILPFAAGNFLGPLVLGRLFDTLGRRPMIAFTYGISGVLLALSGYLFQIGVLNATTQTIAWMVIFFCATIFLSLEKGVLLGMPPFTAMRPS